MSCYTQVKRHTDRFAHKKHTNDYQGESNYGVIIANLIKDGKPDGNGGLNYPCEGLLGKRKFPSIIA